MGTNKNVESSSVIKNKNSSQKCQQLLSSSVHLKLKQLQKQSESLKKTKAFVTTKVTFFSCNKMKVEYIYIHSISIKRSLQLLVSIQTIILSYKYNVF